MRRKFNATFKTKVALEALKEQRTLSELAVKYELHPTQIAEWKKQLISGSKQIFSSTKEQSASDVDKIQDELYKQIGQLTVENEWLKKNLSKYLARNGRMVLVDKENKNLSIHRQCELLDLPRSSYYYIPSEETEENLLLMRKIDELHLAHPYYGVLRLRAELNTVENPINKKRIQRLMRKMGIETLYRKPNTNKPCPWNKRFPYLLRGLKMKRSNQVWSMDITYIPMESGYMYLCAIIDWYSRYVLSWQLSNTMSVSFCTDCLDEAVGNYGTPEILNTDQGRVDSTGQCNFFSPKMQRKHL